MKLVAVPAEDEYLIRHATQVRQHADQHRRDVFLHLCDAKNMQKNTSTTKEIRTSESVRERGFEVRDSRIYLRHFEGDQTNDHAVREKLHEDDSTEDILDLRRETANRCG